MLYFVKEDSISKYVDMSHTRAKEFLPVQRARHQAETIIDVLHGLCGVCEGVSVFLHNKLKKYYFNNLNKFEIWTMSSIKSRTPYNPNNHLSRDRSNSQKKKVMGSNLIKNKENQPSLLNKFKPQ